MHDHCRPGILILPFARFSVVYCTVKTEINVLHFFTHAKQKMPDGLVPILPVRIKTPCKTGIKTKWCVAEAETHEAKCEIKRERRI